MRFALVISMFVGLCSGFILPMFVARSMDSDLIFLLLTIFNPVLMLLSFDQRKRVLFLEEEKIQTDRSIRLVVFCILFVTGMFASLFYSSLMIYGVLIIKLFSFLIEFDSSVFQRENSWWRVLFLRLTEMGLIVLLWFLNLKYFAFIGSFVMAGLIHYNIRRHRLTFFRLSDISERVLPGIQSAATSFLSGMPVYILGASPLSISVTQYAVQASVINGFYMLSSLHYSTFSDKLQKFNSREAILYTSKILVGNVLLVVLGVLFIYRLELIDLFFQVSVKFDEFSIFILLFGILNIVKNYVYTLSYKGDAQNRVAKYRVYNLGLSLIVLFFVDILGIYAFFALLIIHLVECQRASLIVYDIYRKL